MIRVYLWIVQSCDSTREGFARKGNSDNAVSESTKRSKGTPTHQPHSDIQMPVYERAQQEQNVLDFRLLTLLPPTSGTEHGTSYANDISLTGTPPKMSLRK